MQSADLAAREHDQVHVHRLVVKKKCQAFMNDRVGNKLVIVQNQKDCTIAFE